MSKSAHLLLNWSIYFCQKPDKSVGRVPGTIIVTIARSKVMIYNFDRGPVSRRLLFLYDFIFINNYSRTFNYISVILLPRTYVIPVLPIIL